MNNTNTTGSARTSFVWTVRSVVMAVLAISIANAAWTYFVWQTHLSKSAIVQENNRLLDYDRSMMELNKSRIELEKQRGDEQIEAELALASQRSALQQVRELTNVLWKLRVPNSNVLCTLEQLKTNNVGSALAKNSDFIAVLDQLYDKDAKTIATSEEVTAKLTDARRIEALLLETLGAAYQPKAELLSKITNGLAWCVEQESTTHRIELLLKSLRIESGVTASPVNLQGRTPMLKEALATFEVSRAKAQVESMLADARSEEVRKASASVSAQSTTFASVESAPTSAATYQTASTALPVQQYYNTPSVPVIPQYSSYIQPTAVGYSCPPAPQYYQVQYSQATYSPPPVRPYHTFGLPLLFSVKWH